MCIYPELHNINLFSKIQNTHTHTHTHTHTCTHIYTLNDKKIILAHFWKPEAWIQSYRDKIKIWIRISPRAFRKEFTPFLFWLLKATVLLEWWPHKCNLCFCHQCPLWSVFFLHPLFKFNFNWRTVALQYHTGFFHTWAWISHRYRSISSFWTSLLPPSFSYPSKLLQGPGFSSLSHMANSHWLSILNMVHMFSWYCLPSSHLLLPPSTPPISIGLFSASASPLLPCK